MNLFKRIERCNFIPMPLCQNPTSSGISLRELKVIPAVSLPIALADFSRISLRELKALLLFSLFHLLFHESL